MNVYIDESGNSGDNLIDYNQKYFTLAAVGIEKSKLPSLGNKLLDIYKGIPSAKNKELKTNKIIGTRWEPKLIEVYNLLLESNFLPFISIVEKKYMICGKIVENFYDPFYNDKTDNSWTHPLEIKEKIANFFYENLSSQVIKETSIAFRESDTNKVKKAYYQIIDEISQVKTELPVLELLKGAENHLELLCKDMDGAELGFREEISGAKGVLNSPNYTSYFVLLNNLESYFSNANQNASVIFDSSRQFNKAYAELFNTMVNAKQEKWKSKKGDLIFGFKHLKDFSTEKSENNIGVQLSDLVATSTQHIFNKVNSIDESVNLTEFEIFMLGLLYTLFDLQLINNVTSYSSYYKFHSRLILEMEKKSVI